MVTRKSPENEAVSVKDNPLDRASVGKGQAIPRSSPFPGTSRRAGPGEPDPSLSLSLRPLSLDAGAGHPRSQALLSQQLMAEGTLKRLTAHAPPSPLKSSSSFVVQKLLYLCPK